MGTCKVQFQPQAAQVALADKHRSNSASALAAIPHLPAALLQNSESTLLVPALDRRAGKR